MAASMCSNIRGNITLRLSDLTICLSKAFVGISIFPPLLVTIHNNKI